jgi:hypothetical protein
MQKPHSANTRLVKTRKGKVKGRKAPKRKIRSHGGVN